MNSGLPPKSTDAYSEEDIFQRLGTISSEFARLELELRNSVALLIDDNFMRVGEIITENLNYSQNIVLFDRIGHFRLDDQGALKQLESLCPRLREAGKSRNDVLHSAWSYHVDHKQKRRVYSAERVRRSRGPKGDGSQITSIEDFLRIEKMIDDLIWDMQDFATDWL